MILLPTAGTVLLFQETEEGRRLLFKDGAVVAAQDAPREQGELTEAAPWSIEEGWERLEDICCSLHDEPSFPLLPLGTNPLLYVHSVQLVDEQAGPRENQLSGILLEHGPALWITASTLSGIQAFLMSNDGLITGIEIVKGRVERKMDEFPVFSNIAYLRSGVRRWLKEALGEDWTSFK